MSSIVSATTKAPAGSPAKVSRRDTFLSSARALLAEAQGELSREKYDMAMESAYRAALRVAGAVNADSPVIRKRKRLPGSAWDKLALTSASGAQWAATFSSFSRERGRVASGIERSPEPHRVDSLISLAEAFLAESVAGDSTVIKVA